MSGSRQQTAELLRFLSSSGNTRVQVRFMPAVH